MNIKKIMTFGTFDIFHEGHKSFLKQAREANSYLIVVIAREETIKKFKKYSPINTEEYCKQEILKGKLADKVVLGSLKDKYLAIKKYKPDVICLGYDQKFFVDKLEEKLKEFGLVNTNENHQQQAGGFYLRGFTSETI